MLVTMSNTNRMNMGENTCKRKSVSDDKLAPPPRACTVQISWISNGRHRGGTLTHTSTRGSQQARQGSNDDVERGPPGVTCESSTNCWLSRMTSCKMLAVAVDCAKARAPSNDRAAGGGVLGLPLSAADAAQVSRASGYASFATRSEIVFRKTQPAPFEGGGGIKCGEKILKNLLRFIEIYLFNMGRDRNLPTINK